MTIPLVLAFFATVTVTKTQAWPGFPQLAPAAHNRFPRPYLRAQRMKARQAECSGLMIGDERHNLPIRLDADITLDC